MYRLICQKPGNFLSAQMALVSTFFQMFLILGCTFLSRFLIELEAVGLRYSTKSWLNGPIWKLAPQIQSLITWPNLMFNVEQSSSRIDCQSQVIVLVCQKLGGQLPIAQLHTGITWSTEPYHKLISCFQEFWKKIRNFLCFGSLRTW